MRHFSYISSFLVLGSALGFHFPQKLSCRLPSSHLQQQRIANDDQHDEQSFLVPSKSSASDRRSVLSKFVSGVATSVAATGLATICDGQVANAAPPIAIIAEELGYFPVTNRAGETKYVSARVRRKSSEQSIALAQHMKNIGAVMYGSYWCPHCAHQKELFGAEAWNLIPYVECSMKGFYYDNEKVAKVISKIDGFPTWFIPNGKRKNSDWVSGEMPLERLVALSDYKGDFDVLLEGPEVGMSSGSCR